MDGPTLRLVVDGEVMPPRAEREAYSERSQAAPRSRRTHQASPLATARGEVASENHQAAAMPRDDARLVFAQRVAARLEGGKAAILRPEVRKRLLTEGTLMGLRSFDANMIIAVAQDAAQRGVMTDSRDVLGQLRFVGVADRAASPMRVMFLAVFLATLVVAGLAAWIAG